MDTPPDPVPAGPLALRPRVEPQDCPPTRSAPGVVAPPPDAATALLGAFLGGRRATTLRTYRACLQDFASWLGAESVADAARTLLGGSHGDANRLAQAYVNSLVERELAALTIGVRAAALRSLVALARVQGMVPWALEVRVPRGERYRDTRGPGRRGVRALLEQAEGAASPKEMRDRALVRLLTDLALRRGEVGALDAEDVDLGAGTVAVLGKGRGGKVKLTLPDPTRAALADWLAARGDAPGPLFLNFDRRGSRTRLTGTSLGRIVRRLGETAGVPDLRPHGLRHAAVTAALDVARGDVRAVQRFSRHADPRTLLLYDDNRQDKAGEIARAVAAWR